MRPPHQYEEQPDGEDAFPSNLKKKPKLVVEDTIELRRQDDRIVVQSHPAARNHFVPPYQGVPDTPIFHQLEGAQGGGQALNYVPQMMQENDLSPWFGDCEPFHFANPWLPDDGMPLEPGNGMDGSMAVDPSLDAAAAAVGLLLPDSSQEDYSLEAVIKQMVAPAPQPETPSAQRPQTRSGASSPKPEKRNGKPEEMKEARSDQRARGSKQRSSEKSKSITRCRPENHNLLEKKRRDRINEKIQTLQDLIPTSSRSDKASTLQEAITYLQSLQQQLVTLQIMAYMRMTAQMLMLRNNMVASTSLPPAADMASTSTAFPPVPSQFMSHFPQPGFNPFNHNFPMMMPGQQGTQNPMPLFPHMAYFDQQFPHTQQRDDNQ